MRDKWRNFGLGVIRKLIALDWGLQDEGTELTATEAEAPTANARGSVQEIISLSPSLPALERSPDCLLLGACSSRAGKRDNPKT